MLYTFCSLIFFTLFGICYKASVHHKCNPVMMNTGVLFFAGLMALLFLLNSPSQYNFTVTLLGLLGGTFFFAASIFVLYALKNGGKISVCWTMLNLGMVIPVLFSLFFWKETIDFKKILGLLLICSSIILIGQERK